MNKVFGKKSDFSLIKEEGSRIIISYGYQEVDKENATWYEIYLYKKQVPQVSFADVKAAIIADINERTKGNITGGFSWNEMPVWLSDENQRNFSEMQRLGITGRKEKLGELEDGTPVYYTFKSQEELDDFYGKAEAYIHQCLAAGRDEKDGIDWAPYESLFPEQEEPRL